jgi:hypothetical protein
LLQWQVAGVTLTAASPPAKTWSHVVASLGPDRAVLFVDGKRVAEQTLSGAWLIGSHFVVGENYAGLLSDVRIFDTTVDPEATERASP